MLRIPLMVLLLLAGSLAQADGFFRVAQAQDGRWWFVDPQGKAFYSTGINNLTPEGDYAPLLRKSPYAETIRKKYGSISAWAQVTADRMRDWGWNTLASWSDPKPFEGQGFAWTPIVACAKGLKTPGSTVPDFFSEAYEKYAADAAAHAVEGRLQDHNILGYFLDNEMDWGHDYRSPASVFDQYLKLPAGAAGKKAVLEMLVAKYGEIVALNKAWKTGYASWEALAANTSGLSPFKKRSAELLADESELLRRAARRYFEICSKEVRARDANHLLLGIRIISTFSYPEVLEAAGATQDVVSVNFYEFTKLSQKFFPLLLKHQPVVTTDGWLREFYKLVGKPLLISEFGYKAFVPRAPGLSPPIFPTLKNQKVRAERIDRYLENTWASPYILGYHFFQWQDQPFTGRFDGEDSNWGLVNIDDEPYPEVTSLFENFHSKIRTEASRARFK